MHWPFTQFAPPMHAPPMQQGWPPPPHAAQMPLAQMAVIGSHWNPMQQGSPGAPQLTRSALEAAKSGGGGGVDRSRGIALPSPFPQFPTQAASWPGAM